MGVGGVGAGGRQVRAGRCGAAVRAGSWKALTAVVSHSCGESTSSDAMEPARRVLGARGVRTPAQIYVQHSESLSSSLGLAWTHWVSSSTIIHGRGAEEGERGAGAHEEYALDDVG